MKLQIRRLLFLISLISIAAVFSRAQTFEVLHTFVYENQLPIDPEGALAQGRDGALYGITTQGGIGGTFGNGVIYRFVPTSGKLTVLHQFQGQPDGATPEGGLLLGEDGNFYGVTEFGGANNNGTFYQVTPTGSVTVIYSFTNGSDGAGPNALPILASDGNFYGVTDGGGLGYGNIWQMTPCWNANCTFLLRPF